MSMLNILRLLYYLLRAYCVAEVLHTLSPLMLLTAFLCGCIYSHFTDEDKQSQRKGIISPMLHNILVEEVGFFLLIHIFLLIPQSSDSSCQLEFWIET